MAITYSASTTITITYCSRKLNEPHLLGKAVVVGYNKYYNCGNTAKHLHSFSPNPLPRSRSRSRRVGVIRAAESEIMSATEISGIKIIKNPPESKLTELAVRSWPKWGCPPSKFPWTYSSKETCYLLKGKVKVYPDGCDEAVEIGVGDLVEFPKGMSCTWDVSEAVDKHYNFE